MAIRETEPEEISTAPAGHALVPFVNQIILPSVFFAPNGSDAVLAALKAEVRRQAACLDISRPKDREALKSLAYKVSRTKTGLDDAGKELVEGQKRTIAEVDAERLKMRNDLDALKEEVRKPLTDWENVEKERIEAHEAALRMIADEGTRAGLLEDPAEIEAKQTLILNLVNNRVWHEFRQRAELAASLAHTALAMRLEIVRRQAAERAELERLRKENEERQKRERDEAIAREAREKAERRAQEAAQRQREEAERERQRIENERLQAEARARQAEAQRKVDEERHQRELQEAETRRQREAEAAEERRQAERRESDRRAKEAQAQAQRDREAAVLAERERQAEVDRQAEEEAARRERNRKHVKAINSTVAEHMLLNGAPSREVADQIVQGIAQGRIPYCSITY